MFFLSPYSTRIMPREFNTKLDDFEYYFQASISACEKGARWMAALKLLEDMVERRLQSNVVVQSAAISACAKCSKWQLALWILKQLEARQRSVDLVFESVTIMERTSEVERERE